jgi:hypothetical protein
MYDPTKDLERRAPGLRIKVTKQTVRVVDTTPHIPRSTMATQASIRAQATLHSARCSPMAVQRVFHQRMPNVAQHQLCHLGRVGSFTSCTCRQQCRSFARGSRIVASAGSGLSIDLTGMHAPRTERSQMIGKP